MMCLADETQISSAILCAYLLFSAQRKCPSDDTRFALSLPLRGPLPFTSHGRLAVRKAHFRNAANEVLKTLYAQKIADEICVSSARHIISA